MQWSCLKKDIRKRYVKCAKNGAVLTRAKLAIMSKMTKKFQRARYIKY